MVKQTPASEAESGEGLTRGHKKKARTRQQLVEAALRIYARKGSGELALNELAEEAGVSSGTVYNYFHTREEVLEAVGIALAEQLSLQVMTVNADVNNGAERVATGVRSFILKAQKDPEWTRGLISVVRYVESMRSAVADHLRADLQIGLQQGDFKYVNEESAVILVISAAMGAMSAIVEDSAIEHNDSIMAEMILLALGVSAHKANLIAKLPMPQVLVPERTASRGQRSLASFEKALYRRPPSLR